VPGAGLLRVSAEGGSPATVTGLRKRETEPRWPEVLPGGRAVLYSAAPAGANWSSDGMIYIESLDDRERRPLVKGVAPHYLPTGHLVYTRSGTMFAVKFDIARQEVDGKPMPVLDAVHQTDEGGPQVSISQAGSMVYVPLLPPQNRTIVWVDHRGAEQALRIPTRPCAAGFGYIDISWLSLDEPDKRHPFLATKSVEGGAEFSPDGRWLAYVFYESGQNEVYVQPFPGPGEKMQISTDGGAEPVWPRNAHELFFRNGDGMYAVDVRLTPTFSAGPPHRLFEGAYDKGFWGVFRMYDVTADGRRFLMQKGVENTSKSVPINLVVNWFEELRRRVPDLTR
jgi:hypothetical protein